MYVDLSSNDELANIYISIISELQDVEKYTADFLPRGSLDLRELFRFITI